MRQGIHSRGAEVLEIWNTQQSRIRKHEIPWCLFAHIDLCICARFSHRGNPGSHFFWENGTELYEKNSQTMFWYDGHNGCRIFTVLRRIKRGKSFVTSIFRLFYGNFYHEISDVCHSLLIE